MVSTDTFLSDCLFKKSLLSFMVSCLLWLAGNSQDKPPIKFGKVSKEDFYIKSPVVDSNTNAVVVFDKGNIGFEGNSSGWFMYVFKRSCRIHVLKKNGIEAATVEIALYKNENAREKVEDLEATTYNSENGSVVLSKLSSKEIFEEKIDNNHYSKRFTMPAVKEGSIIEYTYTIKSDFTFNLPAWEFQRTDYPVLWSECNVTIPSLLSYMTFTQGYHKYAIDQSGEGFKNYSISRKKDLGILTGVDERLNVSAATIIHRWVMKELPPFKGENFIASALNLIDKISFQLYQTYDGESYHNVANTWKKVIEELMANEEFGKPLSEENRWLDEVIAPLITGGDNELIKAKKIYQYVQKNYTCTNEYSKFIKTNLKDVVKKRSGTVGDINLLLIAMLKHQYINALPVLLSTRAVGRAPKNYPMMERLNYVVGKVNVDKVDYFLDATIPCLPFGKLSQKCYNGQARVISQDSAVANFEADSISETQTTSIIISNAGSGEMNGTYLKKAGFFESLDMRSSIATSSLEAYKKNFQEKFSGDFQLRNIEVDSLQLPEAELTVKSDFSLKNFKEADIVYFNPIIVGAIKQNPFYALKQLYPVEMPYKPDNTFTLIMEIPEGFKVDELPKSVRIKLNEDEGMFEYLINADASIIQLKCRIVLNKATFLSEDYQTLRDFYGFIVNKQAEQIVFKKIK